MAHSLPYIGCALAFQHDTECLGRSRGSMDSNKYDQETHRKSPAAASTDTANNAPHHRSIQSGYGTVNCPSHCVRRKESSRSESHDQEEVNRTD